LHNDDPEFRDQLLFSEFFHGDSGRGLGASHQTGWTGLIALLLGGGQMAAGPAAEAAIAEPVPAG
jgi:hypothetical protein